MTTDSGVNTSFLYFKPNKQCFEIEVDCAEVSSNIPFIDTPWKTCV